MEIRFISLLKKIRLNFMFFFSFCSVSTYFSRSTFCSRCIVRRVLHEPESLLNSWFRGVHSAHAVQILRCLIDYSLPLNDVDCYCSALMSRLGRWCVVYTCDVVNDVNFCKCGNTTYRKSELKVLHHKCFMNYPHPTRAGMVCECMCAIDVDSQKLVYSSGF